MDGLLLLLGLIALGIPVSIIALLIGHSRLRERLRRVEARLEAISAPPASQVQSQPLPNMFEPAPVIEPDPALIPEQPIPGAPLPDDPTIPDGPIVLRPDRASALGAWLQRNWIYVVSAASLALAGVFLVQYSVQNGLLPPYARVIAAYLLGAALVAGGEWLRRRHGDGADSATAYLPSVFAGAGVIILFAASLAAHQIYGLIGPNLTFALLGLSAAFAVVLGWYYGPLLAAVGLLGAAVAPFLVASGAGPTPILYGYYALIAATGLAVDAVRRWAWVSVLALVLGFLGGGMMMLAGAGSPGWLALLLALPWLAITLPPLRLRPDHAGPTVLQSALIKQAGWPIFPVRLAAGAVLVASLAMVFLPGEVPLEGMLAFAALTVLALSLTAAAERAEGLADLALLPALCFLIRLVAEPLAPMPLAAHYLFAPIRAVETSAPMTATSLIAMATLITLGLAWRALRAGPLPRLVGLAAAITAPVAVALAEFLWLPVAVIGPWPWALHVIAVGAVMVALAARFARTDGADHRRAAYATLSALSLIALSFFILTSATALTLALAVLLVAAAWLDRRYDLPELGLFSQIAVAVISYRLVVDPGLGFALDAPLGQVLLAFVGALAGESAAFVILRGKGRVMVSAVLESAAMAQAALLANVLLTRWLLPFGPESALDNAYATTLNALPWLILALTQLWRAQLGGALRLFRLGLAGVAGAMAALGLLVAVVPLNPLLSPYPDAPGALVKGPLILDTLALAYAIPGLILLIAARRPVFSRAIRLSLLAPGAGLLLLYIALEIRRFWQGDWLGAPGVLQYELYSYTVAMMLAGAALLYLSIARRSTTLRRLAMAVIAITVAKVFLADASGLTGLTRVFSFLGLGLSLAGLAWLNRWAGEASTK